MGAEYIVIGTAVLGGLAFAFLLWRSFSKQSRAYALPTLALACVAATYGAAGHGGINLAWAFFTWFLGAALLFGVHAHAIKWLHERA